MTMKSIGKATQLCGTSLIMAAVLTGCGGGGGGGSTAGSSTAVTISGSAIKGPLKNAKISVYRVDAKGAKGSLLKETSSSVDGSYSVVVDGYSGPVIVEATVVPGTTKMYDEATGADITPAAGFILRATVEAQAGKTIQAEINPFTEQATTAALGMTGGLTLGNMAKSHKDLSDTLGFDPSTVKPEFDATTKAPTNAAAAALAALSKMAKDDDLAACIAALDQAAKVKCVTDEVRNKGLTDPTVKLKLQAKLNIENDSAGLPPVTLGQPSGTPVNPATSLDQAKLFFATLRSNAKALNAVDMSLQTELQAVTNDMQSRTTPVVTSSLDALNVAMRGAQLWKDVLQNPNVPFVANHTFFGPPDAFGNRTILGGCSFNSDINYNVLSTSRSDANYIGCGTNGSAVTATDVNGVETSCKNIGDWCYSKWTTRVRLHPDAATPGKFTVYTQTRKAKYILAAGNTTIEANRVTRVEYGAAFPGNASVLTATWDANARPTSITLAGELSPGFRSDNNGVSYYDLALMTWVVKPATISVLGDKHNVNLSAVVSQVGTLQKLALSGSVNLIKAGALDTAISLGAGSYVQATAGNANLGDGSQEVLLKLKANTANSALLGDFKFSAFQFDKSGMNYAPSQLDFTGSVQRNNVNFFEGSFVVKDTTRATFNEMLPTSALNVHKVSLGLNGKVIIAARPTINLTLNVLHTDAGLLNNTSSFNGQYQQGALTINLAGTSNNVGQQSTLTSTDGVKMVLDSTKSIYPITFGAANDAVGSFDTLSNKVSYTDGTYEQF